MSTLLGVCTARVESLFPPVLSKSCSHILLAFKVWFSRNSSSCFQTPSLGSLTWGSEPSLQWVDFSGMCSPVCESPTQQFGVWFYCDCAPPTISLWLLLCLWMWGIFFGEFQCLPVDDCSAVVILVLLQEGVRARPSTPASWTNLSASCLRCCAWAFSSCGKWGLLFVVCGLLIAVASLVAEHGL